jgi:hypothetical protein
MPSQRESAPDTFSDWLKNDKPAPPSDDTFSKWLDDEPTSAELFDRQPKPSPKPTAKAKATVAPVPHASELDAPGKVFKLAVDRSIPVLANLITEWTGTGVHATPGRGINAILVQASNGPSGFQVAITQPARSESRLAYPTPPGPPSGVPNLNNPNVLAWLDRLLADLRGTPTTAHSPLLVLAEEETYAQGALRDRKLVPELKERLTALANDHTATIAVIQHFPGLSPPLMILPIDGEPMPS